MNHRRKICSVAIAVLLITAMAMAHPHMQKSVSAKVGSVDAKVSFFTAPANEEHVMGVANGAFNGSFANFETSADLTIGEMTLPAGQYQVGAIKNGDDDWSLCLYPGRVPRGGSADMSQVIKLPSYFSKDHGNSAHVVFDIGPGVGDMEGKPVLVWHFGNYYLAGALS